MESKKENHKLTYCIIKNSLRTRISLSLSLSLSSLSLSPLSLSVSLTHTHNLCFRCKFQLFVLYF